MGVAEPTGQSVAADSGSVDRELALNIASRHAENYPGHMVYLIGEGPGRGSAICCHFGCTAGTEQPEGERLLARYDYTTKIREAFEL
jgi:hypothetical protein